MVRCQAANRSRQQLGETWPKDFAPLDRDLPFEHDPVIETYKKDLDRTLLRENLHRTLGL